MAAQSLGVWYPTVVDDTLWIEMAQDLHQASSLRSIGGWAGLARRIMLIDSLFRKDRGWTKITRVQCFYKVELLWDRITGMHQNLEVT